MVTRCLLANAYEKDFCFGQTITWVHSHSRSWSNVLTLAILLWSILVEINKVISCDILWQFISYVLFFFWFYCSWKMEHVCLFSLPSYYWVLSKVSLSIQLSVSNSIIDILAVSSAVLCLSPQCVLSFYEPDEILLINQFFFTSYRNF